MDNQEKHRERDAILSGLGLKPRGLGKVRYGVDGLSLHGDATIGASRAGANSQSTFLIRQNYEKKNKQNMDLVNQNYQLQNSLDDQRRTMEAQQLKMQREMEALRSQLEANRNTQT